MATTYLDRIRELVYTSPSGREFRPLWDDAERARGKKAAVDEVPQADLAIVQDLGNKAREYRLEVYFSGSDYDRTADAFDAALGERGPARIQHPVYGDHRVLVVGESEARHFVDGLGRATFSLELVEVVDPAELAGSDNTAAAIQSGADAAAERAADSYTVAATSASDIATVKDRIRRSVRATYRKLGALTSSIESKRREIEAAGRTIDRTLDAALGTPLALGQSVLGLCRSAARTTLSVKAKVDGYAGLIYDTVGGLTGLTLGVAHAIGLVVSGLALALLESSTEGGFISRAEAVDSLAATEAALAAALAALEYLEANVPGYVPDAALLAYIAELRARASAYLLEATYSLPSERRLTLDHAATVLELAARFYGSPDEAARVIAENGLTGDLIYVIPASYEVRYYA